MYIHTHKCVYIHYIYDNTHIYTWWFITPQWNSMLNSVCTLSLASIYISMSIFISISRERTKL